MYIRRRAYYYMYKYPYIYLDPDETLALVNTYLNPYVEDRTAEDLNLPG